MATEWVSKVLSASSKVKCFHGTPDLLPQSPNNPPIDLVFEALKKYSMEHQVAAGAVHVASHHGISALPSAQAHSSYFMAFLRNPVEVTSSQFLEKARNPASIRKAHAWVLKTPFADLHDGAGDTPLFIRCISQCLLHYFECAALPPEVVFLFERYTKDYAEFAKIPAFMGLPPDADMEHAHATVGVLNRHHKTPVMWDEIFERRWTDTQRRLFREVRDRLAAPLPPLQRQPDNYAFIMTL